MKKNLKVILALLIILVIIIVVLVITKEKINEEQPVISYDVNPEVKSGKLSDLETLKIELDNSDKIVAYLNKYYSLNSNSSLEARSLEEIIADDNLSLADYSYLSTYLLKNINIEAGTIRYLAQDLDNLVVVFRDGDLPKYISFTDEGLLVFHHGWSFSDLIKAENLRLGISIEKYLYFPPNTSNFSQEISPYTWQYL